MWAAYFQEVEGHRWTIAVKKLRHQAEYEIEKFVARMTHPEVGIWWTWVEETDVRPTEECEVPEVRGRDDV